MNQPLGHNILQPHRPRHLRFLCSVILLGIAGIGTFASEVFAQSVLNPPPFHPVDQNGFNLLTGRFSHPQMDVGIGNKQSGLQRSIGESHPLEPDSYSDHWSGSLHWGIMYSETLLNRYTVADLLLEGQHYYFRMERLNYDGPRWQNVLVNPHHLTSAGPYMAMKGTMGGIGTSFTCTGAYASWYQGGVCTLKTLDGRIATYAVNSCVPSSYTDCGVWQNKGTLTSITRPDGEVIKITTDNTVFDWTGKEPDLEPPQPIKSVVSSLGWALIYDSANNRVTAVNSSVTYCDPAASGCSVDAHFPTVQKIYTQQGSAGEISGIYRNNILMAQNQFSDVNSPPADVIASPSNITAYFNCDKDLQTTFTHKTVLLGGSGGTEIDGVSYDSKTGEYTGGSDAFIHQYAESVDYQTLRGFGTATCTYKIGGYTWTYAITRSATTSTHTPESITTTVTDPSGAKTTYEMSSFGLESVKDALNRQSSNSYIPETIETDPSGSSDFGLVLTSSSPEGIVTTYTYDTFKRIVGANITSKDGSSSQTFSYSYVNCGADCTKPTSITDAMGNTTSFTYDPVHGGILSETGPAVFDPLAPIDLVNGQLVHPQTRYVYAQLTPYIKNSAGALIASTPVWRLTQTSSCRSATATNPASCVGTNLETTTDFEYNSPNLFLTKKTVRSGTANPSLPYSATNLWESTAYTYDDVGNLVAVDGPRIDVDDKTYTTYDLLRRPVYEIGADPDGSGSLKRVAVYHHYDSDGREDLTKTGTIDAIVFDTAGLPTDVTNFVPTSFTRKTYDATTGLPIKTEVGQP